MQNKNDNNEFEDNYEDEFEKEFGSSGKEDLGFIGDGSKKPMIMIVTIVLAAIAIILLCVVIWMMAHPKKGEESNQVANDHTQEQFVEKTNENTQESSSEDTKESSQEGIGESLPESSEPSKEIIPTSQVPEVLPTDSPDEMVFKSVEESVTAKEMVNLRSKPQSGDDNNLVVQIKNGEILSRVGMNADTGWSKLEYNGQTVYAVDRKSTRLNPVT